MFARPKATSVALPSKRRPLGFGWPVPRPWWAWKSLAGWQRRINPGFGGNGEGCSVTFQCRGVGEASNDIGMSSDVVGYDRRESAGVS